MSVRKVIAVFLLVCFGVILPAAALPLRVCLLESRQSDPDCCSDCDQESNDREPCCLDLDTLPHSPAPQPLINLPPMVATDLPVTLIVPPVMIEPGCSLFEASEPIRGPTSPSAHRAVLGVWSL